MQRDDKRSAMTNAELPDTLRRLLIQQISAQRQ